METIMRKGQPAPRPAKRKKNWTPPQPPPEKAEFCARIHICNAGQCQYRQPCTANTLQPDRTHE
jgi:hypothetical protein